MSPVKRALTSTFGSLKVRNFRLFISGQVVSVSGTWMQTVALGWLVLERTSSGVAVGALLAFQFGPMLLLGLWGGAIADRFDKRFTLIKTQTALAMFALALWLAAVYSWPLWLIYSIVLLQGSVTVIDMPTRQAFVTEMVGRELLPNAVSLNAALFNAARIIGPSLAGVLIATVGLEWTFLVNASSFFAVIYALTLMDPSALVRSVSEGDTRRGVRAGLSYVWASYRLRYTLALMGVFSMFSLNFSVVLPLIARFTFDEGATAFGFLTSVMAAGSVVGALIAASRRRPTKGLLVGSAGAFGLAVTAATFAPSIEVLAVLLVPIGAASVTVISTANATLQMHSSDEMRGRVMALHGLVFLGSTPIGAPIVGWISQTFGPRSGLGVAAAAGLLVALVGATFLGRDRIATRLRAIVPARSRRIGVAEESRSI